MKRVGIGTLASIIFLTAGIAHSQEPSIPLFTPYELQPDESSELKNHLSQIQERVIGTRSADRKGELCESDPVQ